MDFTTMATAHWEHHWKELESCRMTEEMLADGGIPVHSLVRKRVNLTRALLAVVITRRRDEARDLLQRIAVTPATAQGRYEKDDKEKIPEKSSVKRETDRNTSGDGAAEPDQLSDRMKILRALCLHTWEALQRCNWSEDDLADKGLPFTRFVASSLQLTGVFLAILKELGRTDAQAFLIQQFVPAEGSTPAPLPKGMKQALSV